MAQTEQAQGSNPEAKALAAKIVQDQTAEIADADAADAGLTRQAACLGGAQASEQAVAVARPARLITTCLGVKAPGVGTFGRCANLAPE